MNRNCLRALAALAILAGATCASAEIVMYENDNFNGRDYRSDNSISNLADSGFNDTASSVIVRGGRWQFCSDAYFKGTCVTLEPGEYRSLGSMGLNDKVSSARELGWTPDGRGGWQGNNNNPRRGNNRNGDPGNFGGSWGGGERAILFENTHMGGRMFVVNPSGVANLERNDFNDKAASLRIESGYWVFCSDANFQGECRTFGPGDYPDLPRGLNDRISSGRRVSNDYPYRSNPNWRN